MHNYIKSLKELLFFNDSMFGYSVEENDSFFLELLFVNNDQVEDFFSCMKKDIRKLLIDSFGEKYVEEYIRYILYTMFDFSKVEQVKYSNSTCKLYSVIRIKDKLFKVDYEYRNHEFLNTDNLLSSLKEVSEKQKVIDYYEGVSES